MKFIIYLLLLHFFQMNTWIVVYFYKDNSVEAVPNIWFKKNICAWPKDTKLINKSIETRVKPNKKDFTFFSARKLGNKDYGMDYFFQTLKNILVFTIPNLFF